MADSESEQIFDSGRAAVCQDAIKVAGCIAPWAKCFSSSHLTTAPYSAITCSNITEMCKKCQEICIRGVYKEHVELREGRGRFARDLFHTRLWTGAF